MIYIGDLSKFDAEVLRNYAECNSRILEFGCGGSTQILRHYCNGEVISVETSDIWIERTKRNLKLLGIREDVDFRDYYTFTPDGEYDIIFDDGADEFRLPFALATWDHLKVCGYLLIHDCRRSQDVNNIAEFIKQKSAEISSVVFAFSSSNICLIQKCKPNHWCDWNDEEGRAAWLSGYEEVNEEELKKMMDDVRYSE